jgi:hypothetical protein
MHCYYMFRPTVAIIWYLQFLTLNLYLYVLYLPTLASVYTLGVHCSGISFMYCYCVIKCIKY